MTMTQEIFGVDISKAWIDVHTLSTGRHARIAARPEGLARFARRARGALVVLEASGGHERPLMEALARAGVEAARVNPRQAREFARATGRLAKTDRVDARMLAEMGRALELRRLPPPDPDHDRLAALVARREDLRAMLQAETNRLGQASGGEVRRDITSLVRVLQARVEKMTAAIAACVARNGRLARNSRRLQGVPGVGALLAAQILAWLPELGQLDRRRIASLAGLAPLACDSGLNRGKRRIWGGRAPARRALYLAGFLASRHAPDIRAFRARLSAQGKPTKLVLIACARKLLTHLNAMARDNTDYSPQIPA